MLWKNVANSAAGIQPCHLAVQFYLLQQLLLGLQAGNSHGLECSFRIDGTHLWVIRMHEKELAKEIFGRRDLCLL